jgi:membrane-bound ClpP family serine protease
MFSQLTCAAFRVAVVLLVTALLVSVADAAVIKNIATGETLKGTLTKQKVNDMTVFIAENGAKKFLNMDEWKVVEADTETAPAGKAAEKPAAVASKATPAPAKQLVYVIPICGPIESNALAKGVDKALADAKQKKATVVVFRMDTPGGNIAVANKILDLIEQASWTKTVAWVHGDLQRGAISCGAFISLATEAIYMTPETSIGAAVPFLHSTGKYEVDEKFQSVFRARFRTLAEKRGFPIALADAMVDSSPGVVQIFIDDKQRMVSEDEATRLADSHKDDGKFKRGKLVAASGKICCLTADEALEYGLCKNLCKDQDELAKLLELTNPSFIDARVENLPLTDWVAKTADETKKRYEKAKNDYRFNYDQALKVDPIESLDPWKRGTTLWSKQTESCKAYLEVCARALKELEKIAKEDGTDFHISQEFINEKKSELEAEYRRVQNDK